MSIKEFFIRIFSASTNYEFPIWAAVFFAFFAAIGFGRSIIVIWVLSTKRYDEYLTEARTNRKLIRESKREIDNTKVLVEAIKTKTDRLP